MSDETTLDFASVQAIITTENSQMHGSELHGVLGEKGGHPKTLTADNTVHKQLCQFRQRYILRFSMNFLIKFSV